MDKYASAEERTVTAVDCGILELKNAIHNLTFQVGSLQSKIDEYVIDNQNSISFPPSSPNCL